MGCITHLSSNAKCLWQCFHSVYSYLDTHSHQHLRLYIIMYMNHKWKMAEGVILETYFDNFSVEMIRVSIWNMNIHKFLNLNTLIQNMKVWYDLEKPTLVFWAYNHLKSVKKWFVKLYILAKYISRCIVFQSISLLSVGVGWVNVASVDEF